MHGRGNEGVRALPLDGPAAIIMDALFTVKYA